MEKDKEPAGVEHKENGEAQELKPHKDKRRKEKKADPSQEYIDYICSLYGDSYDDREEDSRPWGADWMPGVRANHQSLDAFKTELEEGHDIKLSTAKIRKILITGGCWTTERSREVARLFEKHGSIKRVAEELEVSEALVKTYLPYGKVVYDLEEKSSAARRVERYRAYMERMMERTAAHAGDDGIDIKENTAHDDDREEDNSQGDR